MKPGTLIEILKLVGPKVSDIFVKSRYSCEEKASLMKGGVSRSGLILGTNVNNGGRKKTNKGGHPKMPAFCLVNRKNNYFKINFLVASG